MTKPCRDIPRILYENRYCNQDEFDVVICGGKSKNNTATNEVTKLIYPDLKFSVKLVPTLKSRCSSKTAVIGSDIYILGGYIANHGWTSSFEMFSAKTKHWKELKPIHSGFDRYSVCSFMESVYVFGGSFRIYYPNEVYVNTIYTNNVYKYEPKDNKWYQVESLQTKRIYSACTVFEGKIVVTGGRNEKEWSLDSVESYDHYQNKWTNLSDMIEAKCLHSAVSMGNRMFVIDAFDLTRSEVYDNRSRKFSLFNIIPLGSQLSDSYFKTFNITNKLFVFSNFYSQLYFYVYNVGENRWDLGDYLLNNNFIDNAHYAFEKQPKT